MTARRSSEALDLGAVRWWLPDGAAVGPLRALLATLPERLATAAPLRRGRRKELHRIAGPDGAPLLIKVSRYERGASTARRLRTSKARRELAAAARLAACGIETPLPLAAGEQRRRGRLDTCYLVVAERADLADLARRWDEPGVGPAERRAFCVALGQLARRLHDAGLDHRDLAPNNVLVRRGRAPQLLPIDFERARFRRPLPERSERRALAGLLARAGAAGPGQRLRFLVAYCGGDRDAARARWRELEPELPRAARREIAHWRRTATRPGRRFEPLRAGGWHGFARRDHPALAAVLARARAGGADRDGGASPVCALPALWCWSGRARAPGAAARLWARAQWLAARGLAPEPVALLARGGRVELFWSRGPDARPFAEVAALPAAERAARALARSLRAQGSPRLPAPGALAAEPRPGGRWRALLLAPPR